MITAKEKMNKFLNSSWFISLTTVIALFCYEFHFVEATICYFVIIAAYVFIFEDDITPLFIIPIYAPMIMDRTFKWTLATFIFLAVLAVIFLSTLIYFLIKQIKYKKRKLKLGKLFWAGVVVCIVLLIAGVGTKTFVYRKWWKQILAPVVLLIFYLFALNFSGGQNRRYIAKLFIGMAVFIMLQMLWFLLKSKDPIHIIQTKGILVGSGNMINTAGTFLAIAIPFCFYLANNSKRDWLYCIFGILIYVFLMISGSRGALLVATILLPIGFIVSMVKSREKKRYFIILGCVSVVIIGGIIFSIVHSEVVLSAFMKLGFSANGRTDLYVLAWENFLKTPITGTGIYSPTRVPGLSKTVYYYHSTPLMVLSCTGVIGFVGFAYYYFKKFKIFFKEMSLYKFFALLAMLTIEIYGLFDVTGMMPSMILLTLIFITSAENEENPEKFKSVKEELKTFKNEMVELRHDFVPKRKSKKKSEQTETEAK